MKISFGQVWIGGDALGSRYRARDAFEFYVGKTQVYMTLWRRRIFTWNFAADWDMWKHRNSVRPMCLRSRLYRLMTRFGIIVA